MSQTYEEILAGERVIRSAPGVRHEAICERLHQRVNASLGSAAVRKLLPCRSIVPLSSGSWIRPDLTLVESATGNIWLVAEVISAGDHAPDTVAKKMVYEEVNVPCLWIIDPRYNNVEIYAGSPYGLALRTILYEKEILRDDRWPEFELSVAELFGL